MAPGPEEAALFEMHLRDAEAERYETAYVGQHGPWFQTVELAVIRMALDLRPDDVLADFGSGTGRIAQCLAPFCRQVLAIDRSRRSLDVLRERARDAGIHNISVLELDVSRKLPLELEATKVMCIQVLQHVTSPSGRRTAVENIQQVLPRGGRCVVVNEGYNLIRRLRGRPKEVSGVDALYYYSFTPDELRQLLIAASLRPVRTYGCGVLYWTHYPIMPRILTRLDAMASSIPGTDRVSKFTAVGAIKP